jgi:uncharacterized protein
MKLLIDNITLRPGEKEERLGEIIRDRFGIDFDFDFIISRKSLDARKKERIVYRYRVVIDVPDDRAKVLLEEKDIGVYTEKTFPATVINSAVEKVIIAGTGPAGLFCALRLIEAGARVEMFERGKRVEERMKDIEILESRGILDERSNVLFGEGGAGTYSDGKLTTRIRRPEIDWFFRTLVDLGAPSSILYDAKPHLGTDRLRGIMKNIRDRILASGSVIYFHESVDECVIHQGALHGIKTSGGREIKADRLVLATGHSARDTYAMLEKNGVVLEKKGFAVGVRIEHPADLINKIQYGDSSYSGELPAADYALAYNNPRTGRGVYSFCMCPGGRIINSSSEEERLCTNGMSFSKRNSPYSNAAIVVTVKPEECGPGLLEGIGFQRMIEGGAFSAGGGLFSAPAQRVTSFLNGRVDADLPAVSYRPGVVPVDLGRFMPGWIADELKAGILHFNARMKGFVTGQGILIGAETRTSSPVRISRGEDYQSVSARGLYPVGEGAGYAGGIVSSAVDGIRCADRIMGE